MSDEPETAATPSDAAAQGAEAPTKRRLFFGILTGEELGTKLSAEVERSLGRKALKAWRLPRPDGLHMTLLFLGDVDADLVPSLSAVADRVAAGLPAPELRIAGSGAFPDEEPVRVLWLGLSEAEGSEGRLAGLRDALIAGLKGESLPVGRDAEREFKPHVTVARPRRSGRPTRAFSALELELGWTAPGLVLVESSRGKGPARYTAIHTAAFQKTAQEA